MYNKEVARFGRTLNKSRRETIGHPSLVCSGLVRTLPRLQRNRGEWLVFLPETGKQ